jgi:hypothetical protein
MNAWTSHVGGTRQVVAALTLAGALVTTSGTVWAKPSDGRAAGSELVGTWALNVTLRDCATDAVMGAFNSVTTFQEGGTSSGNTASLAFAPGQRSSEHGAWSQKRRHTYGHRVLALILFDTAANVPGTPGFNPDLPAGPGLFAGWQILSHTITLSDADHYTSSGITEFFKADGTLYRTGCSSSVTERFE